MIDGMFLGQVAEHAGVPVHRVAYAVRNGWLPHPQQVGGYRRWTREEADAVRRYFQSGGGKGKGRPPRKPAATVIEQPQVREAND